MDTSENQGILKSDMNFFTNKNGFKIFSKYWCTGMKSPRALVFIVHGAAEHCNHYTPIAEMLRDQNCYVFAHDHQGHGQSEGSRVHITDFRHYIRDLYEHIDEVKKEFPNKPVFLIGHSMGGTITLLAVLDKPEYFAGIVLIAPAVTPDQDTVGPIRIALGKMVARLFPHFPVLKLGDVWINRDKDAVQKYNDDPLNYHGSLKAKWATCMLSALQEIESKLSTIHIPFLVEHGSADKIVNSKSSEALYDKASSKDKTIKIVQGAYHQLHYEIEPDGSQCRKDILDWIMQRASAS